MSIYVFKYIYISGFKLQGVLAMPEKKSVRVSRRIDVSKFMEKLRKTIRESGIVEPVEWILAFLYAAGGKTPSRIHVQKALFIASRYLDRLRESLEFNAYRMGPWSEEASDALENSLLSGLVTESRDALALTSLGFSKAKAVWNKLGDRDRKILADVASIVNRMTKDELLLYVYTVYGYSEKSDVIEKLLRRRRELAVSMFRKGLVSASLAANIAGEPLPKFIEYLKRKGVKPFTAEVSDIEEAEKL